MHFKSIFLLVSGLAFILKTEEVQAQYQPYSYQHYQKYSDILYGTDSRMHTAAKPLHFNERLKERFDSLHTQNSVASKSWLMRKLFNEHLVQVEKEDHTFYVDFVPDFQIGKDLQGDKRTTWTNTRGIQAGLTIKDKFNLYVDFFENQAVFPAYLSEYISANNVVPGQGTAKTGTTNKMDWMYGTANLSYDVNPYLHITLAYDKNHIGDGYRSLLLSDFSSNYSHLKFTGNIGNVRYTSIWAYMLDPTNPRVADLEDTGSRYGDGIKWGAFQYLDYNATDRLSVGFFQSVIWANKDQSGTRGFDLNYAHPISMIRPIESNNSKSPDKMFLGLNAKYKVLKNLSAYGQFLLGEFTAKEFFANNGYVHNKWGAQLGIRGFNTFGVKGLNFLGEYNFVRPYTYQHFTSISNYSNHAEPLAHPLGANFRELVGLANYSWKRFDFSAQLMYSLFGTDPADGSNMGGDIFQSYGTYVNRYGNKIGQGVKNDLYYADAKVAYVLNPKYNLRLEAGYTQRYRITEGEQTQKSGVISFGLRSTFRNFYNDF